MEDTFIWAHGLRGLVHHGMEGRAPRTTFVPRSWDVGRSFLTSLKIGKQGAWESIL